MSMHRLSILVLSTWSTILALPTLAEAEPRYPQGDTVTAAQGVAIVAVEMTGAPPGLLDILKQNALAGLRQAGVRAIGFDAVQANTGGRADLVGCVTSECLRELGALLDAKRFIKVKVAATGLNYTIEVELYTLDKPDPVRRVNRSCNACNAMDTGATLAKAVSEVVGPPPEMPVRITSEPSGAQLLIDAQEVGSTPYEGKLRAGTHVLRASLEGYEETESTIEVKEEADGVQTFQLVLVIITVEVPEDPTRPFQWARWAGAGATLGALTAGVIWVRIHGDPTCSLDTDAGTCKEIYNTKNQGYIALGVGAGLLAGTVYMFLRDARDARRAEGVQVQGLLLQPRPGGAVAGYRWQF